MEKNSTKYFTLTDLKWGLILAASSLLWVVLEKALGLYGNYIPLYIRATNLYGIPALLIYCLAMINKREKDYGGIMTWKQGFISGLMISVIVLLLTPLLKYISYSLIAPEYFENIIHFGAHVKNKNEAALRGFFNMSNTIKQSMYAIALLGPIAAAMAAMTVKKNIRNVDK